ncbi:MAG: hypothetical protein ACM3S2_17995, partial [Ignavibacteriales bacterium]
IPPENSMGLGALTGLISGKSSAGSLGSKLFGISNSSEDILLAILNSRTTLTNVINKFQLMKYYEIDDANMDKALKAFNADLSFSPNQFGMLELSVLNKNPQMSADIANYFTKILDSLNIVLNIEQAKNNRIFIEQRYQKNLVDLKNSEDSLYRFQKKYGVFAVPQQMEVAVKAAAEIESQLAQKEMEAYFTKQQFGENSPQYQGSQAQVKLLRNKVLELKGADKLSEASNVLFPFKEIPDISISYLRNFRNVEIQNKILEVILPLYEQAKVEEQKSIPTIAVLDKAVAPGLKDSPKRSFIILSLIFLSLFIMIPMIYIGEGSIKKVTYRNPLEIKGANFFRKLARIYRLKFLN